MSKKIKIIIAFIFLAAFFFLPVIPSQYVFMTEIQKKEMDEFCMQHGCGLLILVSPYEYIEASVYNMIVQN